MKMKDRRRVILAILEMKHPELLAQVDMLPALRTLADKHNVTSNRLRADLIALLESRYKHQVVNNVLGYEEV